MIHVGKHEEGITGHQAGISQSLWCLVNVIHRASPNFWPVPNHTVYWQKCVTRPDSSLRYRRYINHLLTYLLLDHKSHVLTIRPSHHNVSSLHYTAVTYFQMDQHVFSLSSSTILRHHDAYNTECQCLGSYNQ